MRIIVIGAPGLGVALAQHLHLEHIQRPEDMRSDSFVLDGAPRSVTEARALDAMLRSRGAEVDAVLWGRGGDPAVLGHYSGRVVELDDTTGIFEAALDGLREVLLAA